jgi:hypothetical protein
MGSALVQFVEHPVELLHAAETHLVGYLCALHFAGAQQRTRLGDAHILYGLEDCFTSLLMEISGEAAFGCASCFGDLIQGYRFRVMV